MTKERATYLWLRLGEFTGPKPCLFDLVLLEQLRAVALYD